METCLESLCKCVLSFSLFGVYHGSLEMSGEDLRLSPSTCKLLSLSARRAGSLTPVLSSPRPPFQARATGRRSWRVEGKETYGFHGAD